MATTVNRIFVLISSSKLISTKQENYLLATADFSVKMFIQETHLCWKEINKTWVNILPTVNMFFEVSYKGIFHCCFAMGEKKYDFLLKIEIFRHKY